MASNFMPSSGKSDRPRLNPTPGPALPRRRIARELRELREKERLLLEDVARRTKVSTSTLSRLENAQGAANALTIRALVDFYGISDTARGNRLEQWARDGRKHAWWKDFPEASTDAIDSYVAYESQATAAKLYTIPFIPVLLQTPDYSREMVNTYYPKDGEDRKARLVEFQQRRQQVLQPRGNQSALKLRAILHESCILQRVGSHEVMSRQLEELVKRVRTHKNIKIQVLPMNRNAHRAMSGTWTLFEYAEDIDSNVALLEHSQGLVVAQLLDEPNAVSKAAENFTELARISLSQEESLERIDAMRTQHFL